MRTIRIGSRGSRLALVQTRAVMDAIEKTLPGVTLELEIIHTQGDRILDRPLSRIGDAGVFIKEIETALLEDRIDVAVHSMKDLPSRIGDGLALAAATRREDPRDALVSRSAPSVEALPPRATVATGSLRRRSQLKALRPDLEVVDLRGNVPTRLEKFDRSQWDAVVLAGAGLLRLGLESRIRCSIPVDEMTPAVGQGAIALETRSDDPELRRRLELLDDRDTARAVLAERSFLARLEGGCRVPIGGYAELRENRLVLQGYVGTLDGRRYLRRKLEGDPEDAAGIGLALAESMLAEGASEIVREFQETT